MELENEDKRPEVWVARRLMRRGCRCESYPIAYFVSKARVQAATRRFLKNGKEVKEYEVEYETPDAIEEISYGSDMYAETGDWVKTDRVFRDYITATNYIDLLNEKLKSREVQSATSIAGAKEVSESVKRDILFARRLEKHFDGITLEDSREL